MFWVKLIIETKKDYFMMFSALQNFLLSLQKEYLLLYQEQKILFMKAKSPLSQFATQVRMQRYWFNFHVCPHSPQKHLQQRNL